MLPDDEQYTLNIECLEYNMMKLVLNMVLANFDPSLFDLREHGKQYDSVAQTS